MSELTTTVADMDGWQMRKARDARGLTIFQAALLARCVPAQLSEWEASEMPSLNEATVENLDRTYGIGVAQQEWVELVDRAFGNTVGRTP